MNFGNWIVVAFVLFAAFIATLVTICVRQDISLVSKDYYKDELAYEQQITRIRNMQSLKQAPNVTLVENKYLKVELNQSDIISNGELKLFCPSNASQDKVFILQSQKQTFAIDELTKGMYKARLTWRMTGKDFYFEKIINF